MPTVSFQSRVVGVTHPVKPLSDVRRGDARRAQIGGPDSIASVFQVNAYSGEPLTPILARNLLSKHDCRSPVADESEEHGPEVALVYDALALADVAERLAGARPCPDFAVVGPAGELKGE